MCECEHLCVSECVCLTVSICVCMSVCMFASVRVSECVCVECVYVWVWVSVCMSMCVCWVCVFVSVCVSVCKCMVIVNVIHMTLHWPASICLTKVVLLLRFIHKSLENEQEQPEKENILNRKAGQAPHSHDSVSCPVPSSTWLWFSGLSCTWPLTYLFQRQVAACLFIAVLGMEPRPACCFPATFLESLTSGVSRIFPEATQQNTGHTLNCQTMRLTDARAVRWLSG